MGTGYGTAAVAVAMMLAAVALEGQEGRVEFERFLDHAQNTKLLDALKKR
jgi:hypothetical protein